MRKLERHRRFTYKTYPELSAAIKAATGVEVHPTTLMKACRTNINPVERTLDAVRAYLATTNRDVLAESGR